MGTGAVNTQDDPPRGILNELGVADQGPVIATDAVLDVAVEPPLRDDFGRRAAGDKQH